MTVEIYQCQRKINESGDRYRLTRTIAAINSSLVENESGIAVGQCKALIENLCKSVLKEKQKDIESNASLSKLAKQAVSALGVGETGNQDKKTRDAFTKLISSFSSQLENAANSIGALRNEYCPLAHGRGHDEPQLHMVYAYLLASQTDALATFVLELIDHHKLFVPEIIFLENEDFNEHLYDEYGEIEIYGDLYQAPEVLFNLNPEIYRRGLNEYKEGEQNDQ